MRAAALFLALSFFSPGLYAGEEDDPSSCLEGLSPSTLVTLRNGSQVVLSLATVVMYHLHRLYDANPVAFNELVFCAQEPGRKIQFPQVEPIIASTGLMKEGSINRNVRDVIVSAVEGESIFLEFVNPIVPSPKP